MLEDRLKEDLKEAMKGGDKTAVSTIRMVISAIKNKKIELGIKEIDDPAVMSVIQKKAKQHKESIKQFTDAGREDLAKNEESELSVIVKYLPEPISESELCEIIDGIILEIEASSMKDMGKVMKLVTEKTEGRADGGTVSRIVKEKLM
jgi:uncharacterized protein